MTDELLKEKMSPDHKLVEAIRISKAFSGTSALTDVSFTLLKGEVHALMGENGAGKSTLSKIITGIYQADEGQVFVEGKPVRFTNTREAISHGVSIVTQEFSLLPDFCVAENIFLTDQRFYKKGFISDKKAMAAETYNLLKLFEMEDFIDPYEKVLNLSVAQMQVVEILKAVSTKAKAIILDEPTASLSIKEIHMLFKLVRQLKEEGVGFIIVSHKISEIYEIADRITVLRDGRLILNGVATETLPQKDLIKAMVGREINDLYGIRRENNGNSFENQKVIFEVQDMTDIEHYVKDITFSVRRGEIIGFSGLVGAGRSELVRCIFGANKRSKGKVFLNGEEIKADSIKASIAKKIGFVTEDRKNDGILQEISILKNVCLADLAACGKILINQKRDESNCGNMIDKLSIKVADFDDPVKRLSGGNQQKVLLAKWLLLNPDVLIVDEPTRGVDIGAKADIYEILRNLAANGMAIIVVSSELPEILGICDTIYVMREGQITARLSADEADEETIGYYSTIGKEV